MARVRAGGTTSDFVYTTVGGVIRVASATLTIWSAETGGTQLTDLLLDGSPVTTIPVPANGQVPDFDLPDGVYDAWASADGGTTRVKLTVASEDAQFAAAVANSTSAARGVLSATYAALPAAGDRAWFVSTNGSDSNNGRSMGSAFATIDAALAAAGSNPAIIHLSWGTHVAPTTSLRDYTTIRGMGRGLTVVQRPAGSPRSCFLNQNTTGGNYYLAFHDLTVDGNRAATLGTPDTTSWYGFYFRGCGQVVYSNVEAKNCNRGGIVMDGLTNGDTSRYVWLNNVEAHGNVDGIMIQNGTRAVHYNGVTAYENDDRGVYLDHSESQSSGIYAFGNGGHGIFINNVYDCQFDGLRANQNGKAGIYVLGFTASYGSRWIAQDNGRLVAGWSDVYIESDGLSPGYGKSQESVIQGVKCGPVADFANYKGAYASPGAHTSDYGLYIEDGTTGRWLRILDVEATPGAVGRIRKPTATSVIVREAGASAVLADNAAQVVVSNTNADSALVSTTLPASSVRVGDHYRVRLYLGVDFIATSGTLDVRLRLGGVSGTLLAGFNIGSQASAATGKNIALEFDLICRSIASGTATWSCSASGMMDYSATALRLTQSTATRSTAADDLLVATATWATANAGNVVRAETATIEKVA